MAILQLAPRPSTILASSTNSNVLALLSPALTHSLYLAAVLQRLLSTTTLFILLRASFVSAILLRQFRHTSQLLLLQSYYASVLMSKTLLLTADQSARLAWKATEQLRKKLIFEFMVFFLGSGGNGLILVLFWPGWIVVGSGLWGICWICG